MTKNRSKGNNSILFMLFAVLLFTSIHAQKKEKFYDYKGKECEPNGARIYSLITKIDSVFSLKEYYINEKKIRFSGSYEDSLCKIKNGKFSWFYPNGKLESTGNYKHNNLEGIWLSYHNNGMMRDSTFYLKNNPKGKRLSWYPNGMQCDSIYKNEDGSGIQVRWFDDGIPSALGRFAAGNNKTGIWKYFHRNGKISAIESYTDAKLINTQYYEEDGVVKNDTINTNRKVQFRGGEAAWLKYLSNHIYFPDNYKIVNADIATVIVTFTVNENGEIENVFTSLPFNKNFDEIAEKAIRNSPKWLPQISHNRKVKTTFSQPVSFGNQR